MSTFKTTQDNLKGLSIDELLEEIIVIEPKLWENDISDKLRIIVTNLESRMWRSNFCKNRKVVMGKISEENIEETLKEVRTALLEADVNFKVVKEFVAAVKEKALGEKVIKGVNPGEQFVKIMHDELAKIMGDANEELNLDRPGIVPILIVGLNGQGKTTFSGKLALHLKNKRKKETRTQKFCVDVV